MPPDFENPGDADRNHNYQVQVTVTDADGAADVQDLTVIVADANEVAGDRLNNTLAGSPGIDQLDGLDGNDNLDGGAGSDRLDGGRGDDMLNGGAAADRLDGGRGDDTLNGGAGPDSLDGNRGDDALHGGTEGDRLDGGRGDDTLDGAAGNDILIGGEGDDVLVYDAADTTTLDAGLGNDALRLTGGDDIDLTAITNNLITGVETLDAETDTGSNALILDTMDALALSETSNDVFVEGDSTDTLALAGGVFAANGTATVGDETYNVFTDASAYANVFVDQDVVVTV